MFDQSAIIRNIIEQVQSTTLSAGHLQGHVITKAQVHAILEALDEPEGASIVANTPTTGVSETGDESSGYDSYDERDRLFKASLAKETQELKALQERIVVAPKSERPDINHQIGRLQSSIARLNRHA